MKKTYIIRFTDEKYPITSQRHKELLNKMTLNFTEYLLDCLGDDIATIEETIINIEIKTIKNGQD